jgi:trehalose 6-phosphate synthase
MRRTLPFLLALLVGLAILVLGGYFVLTRTTRTWFERDLSLRSSLAVGSAKQSLVENWSRPPGRLESVLADITRDERVLGAAACTPEGHLIAATRQFPDSVSWEGAIARLAERPAEGTVTWTQNLPSRPGAVHLSASRVEDDGGTTLGVVLLVHDLAFLDRRDQTTRNLVMVAFVILSLGASVVTILAARFAWRGWTLELQRALTGRAHRDFQPLVRDVRSLVEQLSAERDREAHSGPWSADRLRSALIRNLQGERLVILSNRQPYIHERTPQGIRVQHPASGVVTALEPLMRACSGVWVAHGSGTGDRETVDRNDHVAVPPGEESYVVRRVWLSDDEEKGYYYGFANEGLWPLCHVAHARPMFRTEDWEHYVRVNEKFAAAVCGEVDSSDPIILVQDYHFALAPNMIRSKLPRATIITFWHIPWPNSERIAICPWREEIISGLLGSSILGFHTQGHCNNFIDSVDAFMESRIDRESNAIVQGARRTLIRPYPISIEWPVRWLEGIASVAECRSGVREELGLLPDALVCIGVDRLDYTKGIEERLSALDVLLTRFPEFRGRVVFVQLAAPSRTKIDRYRELNERVENLAQEINARWSAEGYRPIVLLRSHHEPPTVFRYYRAADVCYVSSLHDGMNLVAKEFVAARDDEQGVLILSQFTGAARELTEALIVNPYDLNQASDALAAALRMSDAEQRVRMRSMRRLVSEFNVFRWAGQMLVDAAELRRRERLSGRLSSSDSFPWVGTE